MLFNGFLPPRRHSAQKEHLHSKHDLLSQGEVEPVKLRSGIILLPAEAISGLNVTDL